MRVEKFTVPLAPRNSGRRVDLPGDAAHLSLSDCNQ